MSLKQHANDRMRLSRKQLGANNRHCLGARSLFVSNPQTRFPGCIIVPPPPPTARLGPLFPWLAAWSGCRECRPAQMPPGFCFRGRDIESGAHVCWVSLGTVPLLPARPIVYRLAASRFATIVQMVSFYRYCKELLDTHHLAC